MYNLIRTYWKNSFFIILTIILGKGISFLWKLTLARLGPDKLGEVEVILGIFTALSAFSLLGFHTALIRFSSIFLKQGKKLLTAQLYSFVLKLSLGASLLIAVAASIFPQVIALVTSFSASRIHQLGLLLWSLPFFVLLEMVWSYLLIKENTVLYGFTKFIVQPILRLSFLLLFFKSLQISFLLPLHVVLPFIVTSIVLLRVLPSSFRRIAAEPDRLIRNEFLRYSIPMSGSFIVFTLYGVSDILFLNKFTNLTTVGLYASIMLLADSLDVLFLPFLNLFQIYLSSYHTDRQKGFTFTLSTCIALLVGSSIGAVLIYILREYALSLVLGQTYSTLINIVGYVLLLKVLQSSIALPLRHFLDFYGYVRETLVLMILALVIKIVASATLIPTYGIIGVIVAQASSIVVHIIGCIFFVVIILKKKVASSTFER